MPGHRSEIDCLPRLFEGGAELAEADLGEFMAAVVQEIRDLRLWKANRLAEDKEAREFIKRKFWADQAKLSDDGPPDEEDG